MSDQRTLISSRDPRAQADVRASNVSHLRDQVSRAADPSPSEVFALCRSPRAPSVLVP